MKPLRNILLTLLITMLSIPVFANYNGWTGEPAGSFWKRWSIGLSGGFTSYFGDLSYYDAEPGNKIRFESGPSVGFLITKYLHDDVGLSGQVLIGVLKGGNSNTSFTTNTLEYNAQVRVDVLNLLLRNNPTGVGIFVSGGIGHLYFQARKQSIAENGLQNQTHRSHTPEFVYFGGGGVSIKITERFNVLGEVSVRQAQNDRLDETIKNGDFDYYSFVSVGIIYAIGREFSQRKKINLNRSRARLVYR